MLSPVRSILTLLLDDARLYRRLTTPAGHPVNRALVTIILRNPGLWILQWARVAGYLHRSAVKKGFRWRLAYIIQPVGEYLTTIISKSEVRADCCIESDVYLSNRGYIICGAYRVGAGSVIHDHCTFGEGVANGGAGRPTIGSRVWIGPNCILAGPITVGDGATILPGTFLTFSVRPGALVKGNPARVVADAFDNSSLLRSCELASAPDGKPKPC